MSRDWNIATHEAGHIVVGKALGLQCRKASIVPGRNGSMGRAMVRRPKKWNMALKLVMEDIIFTYAGPIAQVHFARKDELPKGKFIIEGSAGDDKEVRDLLALLTPQIRRELKPKLRRASIDLVKKHRHKIRRVAMQLMKRKALSGRLIDLMV